MSVTPGLETQEKENGWGFLAASLAENSQEILPQKIEEDIERPLLAFAHTAHTEHKHTKKRRTNKSCAVKHSVNDQ